MGFHSSSFVLRLLLVSSLLCSLAAADSAGSVFFIDGPGRRFLRTPSPDDVVSEQLRTMSVSEIGAAVSVLLGFSPPASLSAAGSSKLNEVLMPNPFYRPHSVFMLEVTGDVAVEMDAATSLFQHAIGSKIDLDSDVARIEIPGEEVNVVSLDEESADYTDKEISDLATWLGGSYYADNLAALNGELNVPLADGVTVNLHMSKKADRAFIAGLLALFHNSRRAIEMHEDLSHKHQRPAELLMGCFHGIKALQEEYGPGVIAHQGLELLLATLSKTVDSLEATYKGQIVGVVLFSRRPHPESKSLFNVMLTTHPSARWLVEANTSSNATTAEVVLVRKTLAWLTGIILIISTLIGIYLLLNMPLTRDTLLYSNVKLD